MGICWRTGLGRQRDACRHMKLLFVSVLLAGAVAGMAAQPEPGTPPSYTCDRLEKVPVAQRCNFVSEQCESEGGLPYTQWYYCHVAPRGAAASFFFTLLLAALLPLFFTLLGDTAEVYFSPIMTHVSQSIPKMRPRFAGVTFVAMGNGATDLSANITAIRNGDVLLSAGALTGAAMFVQCVVASEVMRASRGPVKCRGATLRDVGIYIASVVLVLASFAHGRINHWFIVGSALLYLTYAVWVFLGDEWHERGRPEASSVWRSFRGSMSGRLGSLWRRQADDSLPWAVVDLGPGPRPGGWAGGGRDEQLTAPLVPLEAEDERDGDDRGGINSRPGSPAALDGRGGERPHHHHHHLVSAKAYQEMVWAELSNEEQRHRGGGASPSEAAGRGERRQRRRRRQSSLRGPGSRGRGAAGGVELSGARNGALSPEAGAGGVNGGGGGGGGSQLVTLSSLNGSALPVPAPVDAAPLQLETQHRAAPDDSGGAALSRDSGAAGAAAQTRPRLPELQTVPWGGEASGGESDLSEEDEEEGTEDEEEGMLGPRRQQFRGAGEGEGEEDAASQGPQRRGMWSRLQYELTVGASAEWEELPPRSLRRRWRAVTFPLLLPIYAALRFTIPFVDPATYSRRWLVATCLGAPLLAAAYLAPGSWLAAGAALAAGGALAAAMAYFTAGEEDELPDWDFGGGFAFGPAFFAVFGFFMGIIWIDLLASQVVGVIALLASLLRLPASVMGLTLLAWGNSLGDFFGNPAMARRGKPTMALTACFAGPLFNMLTSMAFGFGSYFARRHVGYVDVVLRPEVALGCGFLMVYNVAVAAAGLANRGSLPERFYVFARAWYVVYLAAAVVVGLWAP